MATMNIGNIKDDFYRYKMPRLQTKVEGRGNGIKTVITNMTAIARSLVRDPAYPTKYFGCELGTQAKYDPKTEKAVVNGNHSQEDLLKLLSSYIDKFVLCGTCKNPETSYRIDKKDNIYMECKACGATTHVSPTEKLCTFILKNPPKASPKERGATAQATAKVNVPENIPTVSSNVDEDDWGTEETSKAAAKARRKKLREEGKNVVKDMGELSLEDKAQDKAEDEASESEDDRPNPVEVLKTFLQKKSDASDEAISRIVAKLAEDYEFDNKKVVCLLFEALFDKDIIKQVPKRAPLFEKYVDSEAEQKVIIGYVELFFGQQNPDLIKSVPVALKAFYDADLLDEEVILEWFDSRKKSRFLKDKDALKKVKEAAKVFVEWLKNAEEEDSEEEEDEEESSGSDE